jgi:hypothetical protein
VTKHIIVDGSNIATEGRSEPSLSQLDEAVKALMSEYKGVKVTVVVDATFGHRIAKKERADFDDAIANNELVAPPAGAVGRGDAFVLAIADKVGASILSNDSYQEFHGKYKWLFEPGRLIGGKPVPHVGWVFVERLPVRGPTSRRAVKSGKLVAKEPMKASPAASKPMPVPKAPPPNARPATPQPSTARAGTMANEVMPYLQFVEKHPVGTKVKAVVKSYAANGVTVMIGDVAGYVPLRNMASPLPRSARDVFSLGDAVTLTIVGYTPARRSVDLGVPDVVAVTGQSPTKGAAKKAAASPAKKSTTKKAQAQKSAATAAPAKKPVVKKAPAKKATTKQAPAKAEAAKSAAKKSTAKTPAKKTPAKKASARKA